MNKRLLKACEFFLFGGVMSERYCTFYRGLCLNQRAAGLQIMEWNTPNHVGHLQLLVQGKTWETTTGQSSAEKAV